MFFNAHHSGAKHIYISKSLLVHADFMKYKYSTMDRAVTMNGNVHTEMHVHARDFSRNFLKGED